MIALASLAALETARKDERWRGLSQALITRALPAFASFAA
jgi:hypothetical protein